MAIVVLDSTRGERRGVELPEKKKKNTCNKRTEKINLYTLATRTCSGLSISFLFFCRVYSMVT